jgi:hypothetical protein
VVAALVLAAELCVKKNLSRCKAFKYWRDYFILGSISSAFKRPSVCVSAFTSYDIQHNIQHTSYSRLHEYFRLMSGIIFKRCWINPLHTNFITNQHWCTVIYLVITNALSNSSTWSVPLHLWVHAYSLPFKTILSHI